MNFKPSGLSEEHFMDFKIDPPREGEKKMSEVVLDDKWLRCKDALEVIGASRMTLHRLLAKGQIKCYHTPFGRRFRLSELKRYMESFGE